MTGVARYYVRVDGRRVHLRICGAGPLILLLHQSPQSSADFVDFMQRWRDRFLMIAPDRPGCGLSDPLPIAEPHFDDYADALARLLDVLGIERITVYGFHTGATEALALAARHPSRVSALAGNGVVALDPAELADVEQNYLPPIEPSWDGGHLAWIWARVREQTIFFPWHRRTQEARLDYDVPPPERLQRNALELMAAFDRYAIAYRAAFRFDVARALEDSRCPVMITAAKWDPLFGHLSRLVPTRSAVTVRPGGTALDTERAALDWLEPFASLDWSVAMRSDDQDPLFVAVGSGSLHYLRRGPQYGRGVLLIHDAGERAQLYQPLIESLAATGHRVVAPDLPGHGESSPLSAGAGLVAQRHAESLLNGPLALEREPNVIVGFGAGVLVAAHVAESIGTAATVIGLRPVMPDPDRRSAGQSACRAEPRPDWYGGHLQMAWHRVRSARLFHPWWDARSVRAVTGTPELDPVDIHRRATALLQSGVQGPELAAAAVSDSVGPLLRLPPQSVLLVADERWPAVARQALAAIADEARWASRSWTESTDAVEILAELGTRRA